MYRLHQKKLRTKSYKHDKEYFILTKICPISMMSEQTYIRYSLVSHCLRYTLKDPIIYVNTILFSLNHIMVQGMP